jgi:hypothetical protein
MTEPAPTHYQSAGQYRIVQVEGGYEAQLLYPIGMGKHPDDTRWFPLNSAGYWSDQSTDAYSYGIITKRDVFATHQEAAAAIAKARAINEEPGP